MKRISRWCLRIAALTIPADRMATAHTLVNGRQSAWRTAPKEALRCLALVLSLLLAVTYPAYAVDGVIEINQAKALVGGINGDLGADPPGFPVVITEPGSYRLTGNLVLVDSTFTGIVIDSDDVTVDLNGFEIAGPTVCSGTPVSSCTPSGGGLALDEGRGIWSVFPEPFNDNIVVKNGTVRGMAVHGIDLPATNVRVEGISAISNGVVGILAGLGGPAATVTSCMATSNGEDGIQLRIVGSSAINNTAFGNGNDGIEVRATGRVVGNVAGQNGGFGLRLQSTTGYASNVLNGNSAGTVAGGVQMGTNVCDGNTACP